MARVGGLQHGPLAHHAPVLHGAADPPDAVDLVPVAAVEVLGGELVTGAAAKK